MEFIRRSFVRYYTNIQTAREIRYYRRQFSFTFRLQNSVGIAYLRDESNAMKNT